MNLRQGRAALRAARRRGTGALPGSGVPCAKPGFGECSPRFTAQRVLIKRNSPASREDTAIAAITA
jgi:hypothetical protein